LVNLIGIAILLPFVSGLVCFALKNYKARAIVIIATAITLITVSLILLIRGTFPFEANLDPAWDLAVSGLDYALLAVFLYLGFRDLHRAGLKLRNAVTLGLVVPQIVLLSLFEFGWAPEMPLAVEPTLYADHLSLIMGLIICIIGSLICVYGIKYMADHEKHRKVAQTRQPRFFLFMMIILGAMNGIVFSNNMLWILFFWEVTALCSFFLIRHDETPEAIENGFRALWMNLIGGLGFVIAILLAWNTLGSVSLIHLINNPSPLLLLPLAFLLLAALTKSAQVPFQGWLLGAMVAPVPVSALLHSSTMVKAGTYLAVRLAPAFSGTYLSQMLAIFGGFTFVATAIMAISQSDAKKVLAYSTISNLGLIMLCVGINTPLSITAAMVLILFHAISKAFLFLCVGVIDHSIWSRNIEDMQGLAGKLPLISGITIVGILSMVLIPFGAVFGKWTAIEAAGASGAYLFPLSLTFLVIGSAATTVFWAKWMGRFISQTPSSEKPRLEPFQPGYYIPVLILISSALAFSVMISPVYNSLIAPAVQAFYPLALTTGSGFLTSLTGSFAGWPLFVVLAVVLALIPVFIRFRSKQTRAAYMCGENMAYDVAGFRSVADGETALETGGMYLDRYFGSRKLDISFKIVASVILATLFILVLP
jgi:ech hydrogenase subunit A